MAFVTIPENTIIPHETWFHDNDMSGRLIDAAGEKVAGIFPIKESGSITHIHFHVMPVTTAQPVRVSLQTVGTDGNPTGTLYGGSAAGVLATPTAYTTHEVALGTAASATRGDLVAVVWEFDSTVGSLQIGLGAGTSTAMSIPYVKTYYGSWALAFGTVSVSLKYSDGRFYSPQLPGGLLNGVNIQATHSRGNMFRIPYKAKCNGLALSSTSRSGSFDAKLYDNDGTTVLASKVQLPNQRGTTYLSTFRVYWDSDVTLEANTDYRIIINPQSGANANIYYSETLSSSVLEGLDNIKIYGTYDTGSGWVQETARRYSIIPVITAIDFPSSGGGSWGSGW